MFPRFSRCAKPNQAHHFGMVKNDPRRKYWKETQDITDEAVFRNRRQFMKSAAAIGGGSLIAGSAFSQATEAADFDVKYHVPFNMATQDLFPAKKNEKYAEIPEGREMTDIKDALTYNNFYELGLDKNCYVNAKNYQPFPWEIELAGMCNKPRKVSYDDLIKEFAGAMEERIYRFRCVEAWSMVVPWTGFPLADLLKTADPTSAAKYVKFTSINRPAELPGQKSATYYKWPYYEGLRLDEAMNPMALVAVGSYGRNLAKQAGSPIRIITPWKYGYKGPKAIVKIEFTDEQPGTFWNDAQAKEYGFYSNVEPTKPHPRWSQASERVLGKGARVPTLLYNGYEEEVGDLYTGDEF
ncbi:MAG: sulfoxide reductase catalytic subunit YedY [Verrucomicrobiales bacterium]|jgi:sulfoxide reductase catalytic subunit YedY